MAVALQERTRIGVAFGNVLGFGSEEKPGKLGHRTDTPRACDFPVQARQDRV